MVWQVDIRMYGCTLCTMSLAVTGERLFYCFGHILISLFFFFMIKQHRTFLMSWKTLIKRFCELQTFPPAAKPSQSQPSCCRHHVASGFYSNSSNCGSQAVTNPCRLVLKNDSISWRLWFQLWDESWLCCTTDCFTLKHHRDLTSEQSCQYFTVIQCVCVSCCWNKYVFM